MAETVVSRARSDLGGNIRYGDIHSWVPHLWDFLIGRYGIRSILDVGCGEGHAVNYFHNRGLLAHGIDGLYENVKRSVVPIALHDLLSGPYTMPVDMVWSCEVAEHILPSKVNFYVDTLVNGNVIAMTHAVPGQDGYNHVNCQPDEYWVSLLKERGYRLSEDTATLRTMSIKEGLPNYFTGTGLVFLRGD